MANEGPLPQADLLALYRRLFVATRALEARDRRPRGRRPVADRRRAAARSLPRRGADPVRAGPDRVTCIWVMSRTRSGCGASPARSAARVLLRIEDHDRQRCRPEFDAALLEDLAWLGFRADLGPGPPVRPDAAAAYEAALARLRADGLVYGVRLHAVDVRAWRSAAGRGPGRAARAAVARAGSPGPRAPGRARGRRRRRGWTGCSGRARATSPPAGDLPIRDRHGNWTYGFCVVVDDLRQGIDLVIRGEDLLDATAAQIRLAGSWAAPRRRRSSTTR